MTWLQRYRIRHYAKNSLWVLPVLGVVAAIAAARFLHSLEEAAGWQTRIDPDTARAVLAGLGEPRGSLAGALGRAGTASADPHSSRVWQGRSATLAGADCGAGSLSKQTDSRWQMLGCANLSDGTNLRGPYYAKMRLL